MFKTLEGRKIAAKPLSLTQQSTFNTNMSEFESVLANFCTSDVETLSRKCPTLRSTPLYENAIFYINKVFIPIILTIGGVGNVLNIAVLWRGRRKELKGVSFVYLRHLAVADFLAVFFHIVYIAVVYSKNSLLEWSYHDAIYLGHVNWPLLNSLYCASNLLITMVTFDRYISICHPLKAQRMRSHTTAVIISVVIVIGSFVIHVPEAFQKHVIGRHAQNVTFYVFTSCTTVEEHALYKYLYSWAEPLLSKLLPIVAILFLNPFIIAAYRKSLSIRSSLTQGQQGTEKKNERQAERQLTSLLVCVSTMFVVCTTPAIIVKLVDLIAAPWSGRYCRAYKLFRLFANGIETVNYSVNFYLYSITNRNIRSCCRRLLCAMCPEKIASNDQSISQSASQMTSQMSVATVISQEKPEHQQQQQPHGEQSTAL